ncbi:MAG: ferredoxin--NADP reductase [Bdellovibrionales bacterium]|nr:ferredoxin--NADP reductase [Bdellovibrionales bacterium]
MAQPKYNATVVERNTLSQDLMILKVKLDDPSFSFLPGQYTVLGLLPDAESVVPQKSEVTPLVDSPKKMIMRAYSIASSSSTEEHLEFYLSLVPNGTLTPRLFALKEGDRLYVSPKAVGLFTLERIPRDAHAILVGTGTGLAPYMSILRSQLVCGGDRKFAVLHGARHSWDLGYRAQLEAMAQNCKNFFYFPAISRPKEDPSWSGLCGYLQDVLVSGVLEEQAGLPLDPTKVHVFLCGNPGMIQAAKELLEKRGYTPDKGRVSGTLHTEEYW